MQSTINGRQSRPENPVSREELEISGSPADPARNPDVPVSQAPDANRQDVAFTIVDDPENDSVYKGAGSYAATRAESAIRAVEKAFPPLLFELRFEKNLTALHVQARVPTSVGNDVFLDILSKALASTGTRLAPIAGELCKRQSVANGRT